MKTLGTVERPVSAASSTRIAYPSAPARGKRDEQRARRVGRCRTVLEDCEFAELLQAQPLAFMRILMKTGRTAMPPSIPHPAPVSSEFRTERIHFHYGVVRSHLRKKLLALLAEGARRLAENNHGSG